MGLSKQNDMTFFDKNMTFFDLFLGTVSRKNWKTGQKSQIQGRTAPVFRFLSA